MLELLIVRLIQELSSLGLINIKSIAETLEAMDEYIFVCGSGRLDYDKMAEELKRHPIFLECDRRRAYYAARRLEEIIGKEVYKMRVGVRIGNVYLLFIDDHSDKVASMFPCVRDKRDGCGR